MGSPERCDLAIGIMLLVSGSGLSFYGGWRLVRRHGPRFTGVAAVVVFTATLGFAARCHGQLGLAHLLPVSGVIVLGNWIPIGAAALAGMVAGQSSIPAWRRLAILGMSTGLAWYTVVQDVFTPASWATAPRFNNGVCMQTTADSCSASCAASLLIEHGISARENEMMTLCLTRHGGTPELGLYRGLKLKTEDTPWEVQILPRTPEALLGQDVFPALLLVSADAFGGDARPWWRPRKADHAVVAYGITANGSVEVGDPASGRTTWSIKQFRQRWLGAGLRLIRRETLKRPHRIGVAST
jgi:predicted double-glycine peptidase